MRSISTTEYKHHEGYFPTFIVHFLAPLTGEVPRGCTFGGAYRPDYTVVIALHKLVSRQL